MDSTRVTSNTASENNGEEATAAPLSEGPTTPVLKLESEHHAEGLMLEDHTFKDFRASKIFKLNRKEVSHMNYNINGDFLVTSSLDDEIMIYNCQTGLHCRTALSKKYGCNLAAFTHAPNTILYASTKINDDIRYLSFHDNKFIRYFTGHTDKVICLQQSSVDDAFVTSSLDSTVRVWDLRSDKCRGIMSLSSPGLCTFDPEGQVFCIGSQEINEIKLFDMRSYNKGGFAAFKLPEESIRQPTCDWTSIVFSSDGNNILINTDQCVRVIDGFTGAPKWQFKTENCRMDEGTKFEACFTPDSKYLLAAGSFGKINVWNINSGKLLAVLNCIPTSAVRCLKFNPKLMLMASAGLETAFWLPSAPPAHAVQDVGGSSFDTKA